ncbi:hypothetical protein CF319_g6446 [Tilletia indica]|nr:hypothetical protein CF319_g6446 [Tilletia indica]
MTSAAKRWVRRTGRGSSKDNDVDEDIWDKNDSAFFEEVSRSRTNSLASALDVQEAMRSSFTPGSAVHSRMYADSDLPSSRRPSTSSARHPYQAQGQYPAPTSSPLAFRMPFQAPSAPTKFEAQVGSPPTQDIRRPSIASTFAGSHSPTSGGAPTPSRSGVLQGLKRMMRRKGSKKSTSAGTQSLSNSPVLDAQPSRRSYAANHADRSDFQFSTLPPSAMDPVISAQRVRSPDQIETGSSRAIDDHNPNLSRQRSFRALRDRQGSAPTLHLPYQTTTGPPPHSPQSRFARWQERGSFSGPKLWSSSTADISPTRNISEGTGTPPAWTTTSPIAARRRSSGYLLSLVAPLSAPLHAAEGSFFQQQQQQQKQQHGHSQSQNGCGDHRPMRPRRSADLYFRNSQTDQQVMDAFNNAHNQRWNGLPSPEARYDSVGMSEHSRWKSDTLPHGTLFINPGTPGPSPKARMFPLTVDGHGPAWARPVSAQGVPEASHALGTSASNSTRIRRRSLTPQDAGRLSVMLPSTFAHSAHGHGYSSHHGKSSPVTPSSISRPLSVCSSTFDTSSMNTGNSNSYTPSFSTSFVEPSLPSPRTIESGHGSRRHHSSLYSVSDAQEELEPPTKSYQDGHYYHQHSVSALSSRRPSSSGTNYIDLPYVHGISAPMYGAAAGSTAISRWPYQSQPSIRQSTEARPKSATVSSRRPGSAGSMLQGASTGHFQGVGSYSSCSRAQRRPSFGLNIAPAAAAAFDSIPAPGMNSAHVMRSSQSHSQAKHGPSTTVPVTGPPLTVKSCLGKSSVPRETAVQSLSDSPNIASSDGASTTDLTLVDPFEIRPPVSDAPITPDLNGDLECESEFDFGLGVQGIEPDGSPISALQMGDAQLGKSLPTPDDDGSLELLADDLEDEHEKRDGSRVQGGMEDEAADVELAAQAPEALAIHALCKDHDRERERRAATDANGRRSPYLHPVPSPRQSFSRRRSAQLGHGYALMTPPSGQASLSHSAEDLDRSLPSPTYSYI